MVHAFKDLVENTVHSKEFYRMKKNIIPFCDYLDLTEISYWRVTHQGDYCWVGSHIGWTEYCFNYFHPVDFPCIRLPKPSSPKIILMRNSFNESYKNILTDASRQFGLNIAISIQNKTNEGIEYFGFSSKHHHDRIEEQFLEELPLIYKFIQYYRQENSNLIRLVHENQVNILNNIIATNKEPSHQQKNKQKRFKLLQYYGWGLNEQLASRELEIVPYLAQGYPASYIAKQLHLSTRTVENYIATIKSKLDCNSKVDLIHKAQEMVSIINPI